MLFEKFKVTNLDKIIFNTDIFDKVFPTLVSNLQNIIISGFTCSGKKTFCDLLLNSIYGDGALKVKEVEYTINNYGSNTVKIKLLQSRYHLSLTSTNSALDKYIIQEIVVDFCKKNDTYYFKSGIPYKIIVIKKADILPQTAQFALRRITEQYSQTCRFILICNNTTSIIEPIKQRFYNIRLGCPTETEMKKIITDFLLKESIELPPDKLSEIVLSSKRNIVTSLLLLEHYLLGVEYVCHWRLVADKLINIVCHKIETISSVMLLRDYLSKLFTSNLDSEDIILYMTEKIIKVVRDDEVLVKILELLVRYDCYLKNATRYMLHFESLLFNINLILDSYGLTSNL